MRGGRDLKLDKKCFYIEPNYILTRADGFQLLTLKIICTSASNFWLFKWDFKLLPFAVSTEIEWFIACSFLLSVSLSAIVCKIWEKKRIRDSPKSEVNWFTNHNLLKLNKIFKSPQCCHSVALILWKKNEKIPAQFSKKAIKFINHFDLRITIHTWRPFLFDDTIWIFENFFFFFQILTF